MEELTQGRHFDFTVHSNHEAWTEWFYNVAWDHTWIATDRRRSEITVLAITDNA